MSDGTAYTKGTTIKFDKDATYEIGSDTGSWTIIDEIIKLTPKGGSEQEFGKITNSSKKEFEIQVTDYKGHSGTMVIKKIQDIDLSDKK